MRYLWTITAAILFIASCFFSTRLLLQLADDTATAVAYAAVAVALALVQYASLPRAIALWSENKLSSGIHFATFGLLTSLSIAASTGALIGDTSHQQNQAVTSSTEYRLIISQIEQQQQLIKQLQQTAAIDADNGYRSRSIITLNKIPAIQSQINQLQQELSSIKPQSNTAATELFTRIASRTGLDTDTVMTATYIAIAVLIELALTISVAAAAEPAARVEARAQAQAKPKKSRTFSEYLFDSAKKEWEEINGTFTPESQTDNKQAIKAAPT
ncbi:MAG: hypothetical protein CMH98_19055 [Oceanospirillaceae bacterium]|nr:hypothetical protein [Oceanospirillaceae bacterium]